MRDLASLLKSNPEIIGELAQMLAGMGRGNDRILAHITPEEAATLKANGGSGTINPMTGLPEFTDYGDYGFSGGGSDADYGWFGEDDGASIDGMGRGGSPAPGQEGYFDQETGQKVGPKETNPDETWENMSKAKARDDDFNQGPPDNPWYMNAAANPGKFLGDFATRNAGTIGAIGGGLLGGPIGAAAGSLIGDLGISGKGVGESVMGAAGGALGAGAAGLAGGMAGSYGGARAGQAMDAGAMGFAQGAPGMTQGVAGMGSPWDYGGGNYYDQFGRRIG